MTPQVNASDPPEFLTIADVARRYRCGPRTALRWADAGRLPFGVKLGGLRRWRRADLEAWEAGGCEPLRRPRAVTP